MAGDLEPRRPPRFFKFSTNWSEVLETTKVLGRYKVGCSEVEYSCSLESAVISDERRSKASRYGIDPKRAGQ